MLPRLLQRNTPRTSSFSYGIQHQSIRRIQKTGRSSSMNKQAPAFALFSYPGRWPKEALRRAVGGAYRRRQLRRARTRCRMDHDHQARGSSNPAFEKRPEPKVLTPAHVCRNWWYTNVSLIRARAIVSMSDSVSNGESVMSLGWGYVCRGRTPRETNPMWCRAFGDGSHTLRLILVPIAGHRSKRRTHSMSMLRR